jgi:hypothetical protein
MNKKTADDQLHASMGFGARVTLYAGLLCLCGWTVAAGPAAHAPETETNRFAFGIFWPPEVPTETQATRERPLLNGSLITRSEQTSDRSLVVHLRLELTRPADQAGREFWNSRLAFPEYDWMRYVRVWDKDNQWLWPNLPYLLRLHGIERVERYGGVDPGKGVDNDFAAVLIRKYDERGEHEDQVTKERPLVAAEWYPVGVSTVVNKQTIVHTARSDEFTLHPGIPQDQVRGMAAIWLIYADFMGARLPEAWPKAPEWAGGVLAYFEMRWDLHAAPGQRIRLHQLVPKRSAGFDWERWATRTRAARDPSSTAKLLDVEAGKVDSTKSSQPGKVGHATSQNPPPTQP